VDALAERPERTDEMVARCVLWENECTVKPLCLLVSLCLFTIVTRDGGTSTAVQAVLGQRETVVVLSTTGQTHPGEPRSGC